MNNKDIIQRFLFENANVRGEIVRLGDSFQTIIGQHQYPPAIRKLLGEMLVSVSLLSAIIKFKGRLTVQFQGKNPLKLILAQSNHEFNLRGLAQWQVDDFSEKDLVTVLKNGILAIIINPDGSTKPYQGVVAWKGSTLAESLEGYFNDSEQLPTRIWLAVNETTAAGLLLQPLPSEGHKTKPVVGDRDWEHIIHLSNTITPEELLTLDNQTLLHRLYSQEEVRVFPSDAVTFRCTCSSERCENAILMLGEEEAEQELKNKQSIVVTCEFCNREYTFDRVDVANIFKKGNKNSTQVH